MSDGHARERIATDLDQTFLVEAAAGTGKTTALVGRMVGLIERGAKVERMAALTFTDKAAGELKLRLRIELERARTQLDPQAQGALIEAIGNLERAKISTLHTFAADLLRERPVEAGIDPRFSPLAEGEATTLFEECFAGWLEDRLRDPERPLRRLLARAHVDTEGLRRAAWVLSETKHLDRPWKSPTLDRASLRGRCQALLSDFETLATKGDPKHWVQAQLRPMLAAAKRATLMDEDDFEAALAGLLKLDLFKRIRVGYSKRFGTGISSAEFKEAVATLGAALTTQLAELDADLAVFTRTELLAVVERYGQRKSALGVLDFNDMIQYARRLLCERPDVRQAFARRFDHLLVDEFQDTDPSQAAIVMLLASDAPDPEAPHTSLPAPGKLFVVGDPKQSIYRFRNADIAIYETVKRAIVAAGGEVLHLSRSFRGRPDLQDFVNASFAPLMQADPESLQAAYVPLEPARPAGGELPAVWGLPLTGVQGRSGYATKDRTREAAAQRIVDFVARSVGGEGPLLQDREGQWVAPAPQDICILVRNIGGYFEQFVATIVAGLLEHGIPHSVVGADLGGDRDELRGIVAALAAVEHVSDRLSVYAALKGFAFGFRDDELLAYQQLGSLSPLAPVPESVPDELARVTQALDLIGQLHRRRNRQTVGATLDQLMNGVAGYVGLGLSPAGEYALSSLSSLRQRAHAHDRSGGLSYRSFIDDIADESGRPRVVTHGEDDQSAGVRIMTVHKAKGLEFPVVVLGDLTVSETRAPSRVVSDPERLAAFEICGLAPIDLVERRAVEQAREQAEVVRLAYVAATRARDVLVLPFVAGEPSYPTGGWMAPLTAGLVLPRDTSVAPGFEAVAHGVQSAPFGSFYSDTVLGELPQTESTAKRRAPAMPGTELLKRGGDLVVMASDKERFDAMEAERARVVAASGIPSVVCSTATQAKSLAPVGAASAVTRVIVAREPDRPRGPRFGNLLHLLLATADLGAELGQLQALASALGRSLGASEPEMAAAAIAAQRALAHDLLLRAGASEARGELRREVSLVYRRADGGLVDGVVDLAFRENGAWTVVDYKSDDPDRLDAVLGAGYQQQVALYVAGIGDAMKEPAHGVLLFV